MEHDQGFASGAATGGGAMDFSHPTGCVHARLSLLIGVGKSGMPVEVTTARTYNSSPLSVYEGVRPSTLASTSPMGGVPASV
mgnify:CR=1 FL=1